MLRLSLLALLLGFVVIAEAKTYRDPGVPENSRSLTLAEHGQEFRPLSGYIKDHIKPLCAGGAIARVHAMADGEGAKQKDREERKMCRK